VLDNNYELCIVSLYASGGLVTYLYHLWQFLNRRAVRTLLVTDITDLKMSLHSDVINLGKYKEKQIRNVLSELKRYNFASLYVCQIYSVPYLLYFLQTIPTLLHMECWPGELRRLRRLLAETRNTPKTDRPEGEILSSSYKMILSHRIGDLPKLHDFNYLKCYFSAIKSAEFIASFVKQDLPILKQLLSETGRNYDILSYLPPMLDTALFKPLTRVRSPKHNLVINGKKTFQGNAKYSFEVTCKALDNCRSDWTAIVSGKGIAASRTIKSNRTIKILRRIPYNMVPKVLGTADAYVLLSKGHEGFSVSTLEAMACGCIPIISSFVARRMAGVVVDNRNGFILQNPEDLAEVLDRISIEPKAVSKMKEKAIEEVGRRHSLEHLFKVPFFSRLLESRRI
jgi:glycosyltransferase involved in cell wall biosynthesis